MIKAKPKPLKQILIEAGDMVYPEPDDLRQPLHEHPLLLFLVVGLKRLLVVVAGEQLSLVLEVDLH